MEQRSKRVKNLDKRKDPIKNQKSKSQTQKISPARLATFEILLKIEKEKAFSSVLLPLYEKKLESKDRALCHELTLGVLRRQFYLDRITQKFIKGKMEKLDAEVLISLRMGIYQLVFLNRIPPFAAINESVSLVQRAKKSSARGLVNAVLRNVERQKDFQFEFKDEIEKICVETSHPAWLIEHWTKNFGFEATAKLAKSNNETPQMSFRLTNKSDEKTVEILKKLGLEIEESKIAANAWIVLKGNELLQAYADSGKIYFQEESSQLVGEAVNLRAGESFLDVCAAPGSKTTYVSKKAQVKRQNKGANFIVGGDKYFHRLRVLKENSGKVGAEDVQIVSYDAETALPFSEETFDWVLIDAPCSGTGTIRHNPEIRYFLRAEDFNGLSEKQLKILKNASKVLKKGGHLVYSTCSLERIENEAVVKTFLAENSHFQKIVPNLPQQFLTSEGFARTFPQRDQTDGFFIAVLEKR